MGTRKYGAFSLRIRKNRKVPPKTVGAKVHVCRASPSVPGTHWRGWHSRVLKLLFAEKKASQISNEQYPTSKQNNENEINEQFSNAVKEISISTC